MAGASAIGMVQHGPRELVETAIEKPHLPPGSALLRVEACGLCGTDIDSVDGHDTQTEKAGKLGLSAFPRIIGHEIVGVVEAVGEGGRRDHRVGDRIAVDPWLPCGSCPFCLEGKSMHCSGWDFSPACYGFIGMGVEPGLWGGYSSHVYLHPKAVAYAVPAHLDAATAALWNPLAAGIQWAVLTPGTTIGANVAILGAGQRGLASVVAARAAGAASIVVTGLGKDAAKLELALELGASAAVDVEREDVEEQVLRWTGGEGADVVLDTSSFSTAPVNDTVRLLRPGGTIVWAGLKAKGVPDFPIDDAIHKSARIEAVLGVSSLAYQQAIAMLAAGDSPIERLRTHSFDFREALRAVDVLAGRDPAEQAVNVVLTSDDA
jgi:threonine dehydrogenase-like Zn-dependent dehydrogenase